jgi:regulatory protein
VDGVQAGERRAQDPETLREHARAVAWGALNRRERTEAELRALLARKRVAPEDADAVLGELLAGGYVDDVHYAERFAEDRRRLDGWGGERIEQRLRALGVDRELAARAAGGRAPAEELEAALTLLRRRVPEPPSTPRERDRALGMLVRKGYALELAHDALRRHAGAPGADWE